MKRLSIGTRSVLFGAHCFFIHPWFVAAAWWRLYSFPWDPRLWVAFFVHDLGYVGRGNMDGPEGEEHVRFGAELMHRLFDRTVARNCHYCPDLTDAETERMRSLGWHLDRRYEAIGGQATGVFTRTIRGTKWRDFCLYHSRFWAKRDGAQPSRLCAADKLAVALEPWWLYLPRVIASGEIQEYMTASRSAALGRDTLPPNKYSGEPQCTEVVDVQGLSHRRAWHKVMTNYCRQWAYKHANGDPDTWTSPAPRGVTLCCDGCETRHTVEDAADELQADVRASSDAGWLVSVDRNGRKRLCPQCLAAEQAACRCVTPDDTPAVAPPASPGPRPVVRLVQVFTWACPDCGVGNEVRPTHLDPGPNSYAHVFAMLGLPARVTCRDCLHTFHATPATEEPARVKS